MIVGRWYLRVGWASGMGYVQGAYYPPVLAYVRGDRLYWGKGGSLDIGPVMWWWVHVSYSERW